MIYGANGYTGRLIAEEAVRRGMRPVLGGRSRGAVEDLAAGLGCECRVFPLGKPSRTAEHLTGVTTVLHCAGPFSATGEPMMDACLAAGADYLDITGEIPVIEAAAARHEEGRRMSRALMPAVGFDVVPSDCLAAKLAERLPGATLLQIAFSTLIHVSPGTAKTALEALPRGGRVRREGKIVKVPVAWKTIEAPMPGGPRTAVSVPWGDVASAWYTTGIPNIEVYMTMRRDQIEQLRKARAMFWVLRLWPIRRFLKRGISKRIVGPTAEQRERGRASFWGRASDDQGHSVEATLETPEGYRLTVATALAAVDRVLRRAAPTGFSTPAGAFGADFILEIPGVQFS
jgi:short subunit dehydrogenase-like uncharacterized protein